MQGRQRPPCFEDENNQEGREGHGKEVQEGAKGQGEEGPSLAPPMLGHRVQQVHQL